jgi:hypothetical protein
MSIFINLIRFSQAIYEQLKAYILILFYIIRRRIHSLCYKKRPPSSVRASFLVITIPGAGGFDAQFGAIVKKVLVQNLPLKVLAYKPRRGMMCEQEATILANILLREQKKYEHIILIAHSRGGLLANEALKLLSCSENITLITLATPWHGAIMAERVMRLQRFKNGHRMIAALSWMLGTPVESCTYSYEPYTTEKAKIYPIAARYDLIVGSSTRQKPAEELMALIPTTHLGIPFHHKTVQLVLDIIQHIKDR